MRLSTIRPIGTNNKEAPMARGKAEQKYHKKGEVFLEKLIQKVKKTKMSIG